MSFSWDKYAHTVEIGAFEAQNVSKNRLFGVDNDASGIIPEREIY